MTESSKTTSQTSIFSDSKQDPFSMALTMGSEQVQVNDCESMGARKAFKNLFKQAIYPIIGMVITPAYQVLNTIYLGQN
jgi:hypothetical protein